MTDSFTTLWTKDRIKSLKQFNLKGTVFNTLFGGPHTSEPSFQRAGVKTGDYVYPIWISKGTLYVIARIRVIEIIPLEDYIESHPEVFAGCERSPWSGVTFENYLKLHPERRFLAPTCTDEVVLCDDSTPIHWDVAVPPDLLKQLRFRSQRRERGLKHIVDGRLIKSIELQGIFRLSEPSAHQIAGLLISRDLIQ